MQETSVLLHLLKNKWYDRRGLAVVEILGVLMLTAVLPNSGIEYILPKRYWFTLYFLLPGVILILWLCSRRHLPKNKRGKIGITIAIYSETQKEEMRIKSDFIREFRSAVVSQFSGVK